MDAEIILKSETLRNLIGAERRGKSGRLASLESLPFPDKKFDLVTGFNSFQYAGNPGVALGEANSYEAAYLIERLIVIA